MEISPSISLPEPWPAARHAALRRLLRTQTEPAGGHRPIPREGRVGRYAMKPRHKDTVRSFLFGAVVGSGLALAFAPAPGWETRSIVQRKVEHATTSTRELGGRIVEKGREALDSAASALRRIARR